MTKPTSRAEPEILTSKPKPSLCGVCNSPNVTCCEVTMNARWKVYYIQCQKCHEIEIFKIGKEKESK